MLSFNRDLIRRYDCYGPRYTSYPTAVHFHEGFDAAAYREAARESEAAASGCALSLYVHIPFCASPCFYCGCNKIITRNPERARTYLAHLKKEIELQGALFDSGRTVEQLHFGGGTPTFLSVEQIEALLKDLAGSFRLTGDPDREYSIEIDPRTVTPATIDALAHLGFNRMSVGVQDFDPRVQEAINRIQPVEQTVQVIDAARRAGFGSVSVDLIYGLPRQTVPGFARTLATMLDVRPDRFAVYGYAHLPHVFKPQRRLRAEELPSPEARLALLELTVETLTGAGYEYIGMDHFALPGDELVYARREKTLHRNFQGYSTRADCDLVGLGVSAIGKIGTTYAQNYKALPPYYAALEAGHLPIQRGIRLTRDDVIRRAVIQELMCQERVDFAEISTAHGIDFERYFAPELEKLQTLAADGLVTLDRGSIVVTDAGRLLSRNVAMVFDAWLGGRPAAPVYSKVI